MCVCVCVCVCGGARGLKQLRSGEAWGWSSFAAEKPGGGAASQRRSLGLEQLCSGEAWEKQAQPRLKVSIDSDKSS